MRKWVCTICGYVYEGPEAPDVCPICKAPKSMFEDAGPVEAAAEPAAATKKWVCTVCGYIHEGDEPPAFCPICRAPKEKFELQGGDPTAWAAEHIVGIAKDAPADIKEGLKANFAGECSEVGMYLAMSRVAHREGYPEIGLYWEKAAFEEAEHAAKFAELLGEVLTDSTKENLTKRVDAEFGATQGKVDLANKAKAAGLDAVYTTVMEMAKDEARHGKALKGLLERYFK